MQRQDSPIPETTAKAVNPGSPGKLQGAARGRRARRIPGGRRRRRGLPHIALNLTPMIDMVFLLLFFFLAVSRFGPQEGMLPTQLPIRTAAAADIPQTPIRVRFVADSADPDQCLVSVDRFNEEPLAILTLAENLGKIKQIPGFVARTPVHLMAGEDILWDHVVNAYNAALAAGYEKIYFADSP
ncbi:MAG: hypothetical protein GXY44_13320 [Phycisphaerales bacterium]|nr:hypothetical protein [Phycisphaerales bacterium]